MDLGGWLRSLGLERYEGAFRENEISQKVLPSLTAEDLKDLGVGIVGRVQLLRRPLVDEAVHGPKQDMVASSFNARFSGDLPWWRRGSEKWARLCLASIRRTSSGHGPRS